MLGVLEEIACLRSSLRSRNKCLIWGSEAPIPDMASWPIVNTPRNLPGDRPLSERLIHMTMTRADEWATHWGDRKSTRLNSSHVAISYAVFCLKKKKYMENARRTQLVT